MSDSIMTPVTASPLNVLSALPVSITGQQAMELWICGGHDSWLLASLEHMARQAGLRFEYARWGDQVVIQLMETMQWSKPGERGAMSQAPYSWQFTGSCPSCGSPIYGRIRKPGREWELQGTGKEDITILEAEQPEARRTCPASCPHGKAVST